MRSLLNICIALFFVQTLFSQGIIDGFYKPKGAASIVVGYGAENFKNYFAGKDKIDLGRDSFYISLFADYGITDAFTVSVSLPYIESGETNKDFQDFRFLLKGKIKEIKTDTGRLSLGAAAGFSTPFSDYRSGGLFALGQRATIIESRLIGQFNFNNGWFTSLQTGFSYKFDSTPNSVPITFKGGLATATYYFDAYYDYQHSFGGIDYLGTPSPQNFELFGVDYHKVGGSFYYAFYKEFGVTVHASYILGGRNTFQGPSYGLGLVYNFRK